MSSTEANTEATIEANTGAPLLHLKDIEAELQAFHHGDHRALTTAFFGTGPRGSRLNIEVRASDQTRRSVTFETAPVSCELELRRALAQKPKDAELALLVSYPVVRFPDDLQGRIAGGRVRFIDRTQRLARVLNADRVAPELERASALRDVLLADETVRAPSQKIITATAANAWRAVLCSYAGFPDEPLSEPTLVAHVSVSEASARTKERLGASTALGRELLDYLAASEGPIARAAWRSWLRGEGTLCAAMALLVQAAHATGAFEGNAAVRAVLEEKLHALDSDLAKLSRPEGLALRDRMAALADRVAFALTHEQLEKVAFAADQLVRNDDVRRALSQSHFLPSAWDAQEAELASALTIAVSAKGEAAITAIGNAATALDRLSHHELRRLVRGERLPRARMATRVAAYLLHRSVNGVSVEGGTFETLYAHSEHYLQHGGLLDLARASARTAGTTPLDEAIAGVLAKADTQREADNKAFARALVSWVATGMDVRHRRVVPIERAVDDVLLPFLKQQSERRALVLLLDGMSHANLAELLDDLETKGYAPLRFAKNGGAVPMLAVLPTVTEVSRSSFFAGRRIVRQDDTGTQKDPQRFREHKAIEAIAGEPLLLLKANVDRGDGHVSDDALKAIASERRVVGVVVNALDDQLKGSGQIRAGANLATIRPLSALLDAATRAGRAIMLVADHGHVPLTSMRSVSASAEGSRYRALAPDEQPNDDEVVLSRDLAAAPRGRDRIAMLWSERTVYGSPGGAGTHGGASLPEVVTPIVWIGAADLVHLAQQAGEADPGLEIEKLAKPDWWNLELPSAQKPQPEATVAAKPAQMTLFVAPPKPAPKVDSTAMTEWNKLLLGYAPFKARSKAEVAKLLKDVVPRIALLVDHDGRMSRDVFAQKAGLLPQRVPQLISAMQEWVNIDGEHILSFERESDRIVLKHLELRRLLEE